VLKGLVCFWLVVSSFIFLPCPFLVRKNSQHRFSLRIRFFGSWFFRSLWGVLPSVPQRHRTLSFFSSHFLPHLISPVVPFLLLLQLLVSPFRIPFSGFILYRRASFSPGFEPPIWFSLCLVWGFLTYNNFPYFSSSPTCIFSCPLLCRRRFPPRRHCKWAVRLMSAY